MGKYRRDIVNEAVVREMAEILPEIKDPRVADCFVTITAARVSPDLKYAKLWFSSMSKDKKEIKRGLISASGFIRSRLAERLNLRVTPELTFEEDTSFENAAQIASILKTVREDAAKRSYAAPDAIQGAIQGAEQGDIRGDIQSDAVRDGDIGEDDDAELPRT